MVKPYSQDLRVRVILAVEEGNLSRREAARRYRVSASIAVKWLQQYRRFGRRKARPMGGDRRSVLKPVRDWLLKLIGKEPDLTLMAVSKRLMKEQGVKADASMLCRFFKAEKISFKKNLARRRAAETRRRGSAAKLA
jgi:transposase